MGKSSTLKKYENEIVANIYETYDYERFTFYEENRGKKLTDGLDRHRANNLQRLINNGEYYTEYGEVTVNLNFTIINGRHTYEVRKRNKMPIRYKFIEHENFQGEKKELFAPVFDINKHSSSWSNKNMYETALAHKYPVAVMFSEIIKLHKYKFRWVELMGILKQNPDVFQAGAVRHKLGPKVFEEKKLVEYMKTPEFNFELNLFVRFNDKARGGRKMYLLACIYKMIYRTNLVNPSKLAAAFEAMPDERIRSIREMPKFVEQIIKQYNSLHGESLNPYAILSDLKHFGKQKTKLK